MDHEEWKKCRPMKKYKESCSADNVDRTSAGNGIKLGDFMDVVSPRVSPNLIKNRHLDHLPVVSKPKGSSASASINLDTDEDSIRMMSAKLCQTQDKWQL